MRRHIVCSLIVMLIISVVGNGADGLRSLGSSVDRKEFQNLLVEMLEENNIEFVRVEEEDYDSRFLRCVELVREMMGEQR